VVRRLARWLTYLGIVATVLGLGKLHASVLAESAYSFTGTDRFAWLFAYMLLLAVTAYGVGLPDIPQSARSAVLSSVAATGGAALGMSVLQLVVGDALLPRFVVFGSALVLTPWYLVCVAIARGGKLQAEGRDRVAAVGEPSELVGLDADLHLEPERPATLAVVLSLADAEGAEQDRERPLIDEVRAHRATVLVLSREAQSSESIVAQAGTLHEAGVRIRTLSLFYEHWLGKLPLSEIGRVSLMFDIGEVHRARYGQVKRLLDVLFGLVGLVVLVVSIPFVVVGNLAGNRGPLFYRQVRVGKNGEPFEILKFRTMVPAPEDLTTSWTTEDDPRITRFGRVLRRTHLDELPQAVNIVRGELSIVGPRPEQPHYVAELEEKLPFYDLRHLVRPGLTGWAQVKHGYAADEGDAMEKLQYEFFYLRHQRLSLDLRIIGRTIRSVLGGDGR
jgi:lipopolysaccharide/colanic/teichoic acid biosynthesis glycosyltransferase